MNIPPGSNFWCSWQVAKATNKLSEYTHKSALRSDIIKAITHIYQELNKDDFFFLERCLDGYIQNSNESLNALIWTFAGSKTLNAKMNLLMLNA